MEVAEAAVAEAAEAVVVAAVVVAAEPLAEPRPERTLVHFHGWSS